MSDKRRMFTDQQIKDLRKLRTEVCVCGRKRYTLEKLADMYGISAVAVHKICQYKSYRDVR